MAECGRAFGFETAVALEEDGVKALGDGGEGDGGLIREGWIASDKLGEKAVANGFGVGEPSSREEKIGMNPKNERIVGVFSEKGCCGVECGLIIARREVVLKNGKIIGLRRGSGAKGVPDQGSLVRRDELARNRSGRVDEEI